MSFVRNILMVAAQMIWQSSMKKQNQSTARVKNSRIWLPLKWKKEKLDEEAVQSSAIPNKKRKKDLSRQALTQKVKIHWTQNLHYRHTRHHRLHRLRHLILDLIKRRRRIIRRETNIVTWKIICTASTINSRLDKNLTGKIRYWKRQLLALSHTLKGVRLLLKVSIAYHCSKFERFFYVQ
jgi:hypothetical protein